MDVNMTFNWQSDPDKAMAEASNVGTDTFWPEEALLHAFCDLAEQFASCLTDLSALQSQGS